MNKAISTLIAAVAALTLSGGAYAQAGGGSSGSSSGSTASPANQMNQMPGATGGYGTPGTTNSDSGMAGKAPNSGLPSSNSNSTSGTSAPKQQHAGHPEREVSGRRLITAGKNNNQPRTSASAKRTSVSIAWGARIIVIGAPVRG